MPLIVNLGKEEYVNKRKEMNKICLRNGMWSEKKVGLLEWEIRKLFVVAL